MKINIQTLDKKIWKKDQLAAFLQQCYFDNDDIEIDLMPEGSCAEYLGLYNMLDTFCSSTGYQKNRIKLHTANMIEHHCEYQIVKHSDYWYEINGVQDWLQKNTLSTDIDIRKHFANFVSRSNWARLWVATVLDLYFKDKSLQTYHYDCNKENYNFNGYIGIDELVKYQCPFTVEAASFIKTCPRTLDIDYLKNLDYSQSFFQHNSSYYPIQYPANLNLLQYYRNIFVDVVVETNVLGQSFLCTEKTWRPIAAKRPFIIVGSFRFLDNLKKMGFKTFNHYWDESYDDFGEADRIVSIQNTINQIAQWDLQQLTEMLNDMQHILDHNLKTFLNLTSAQVSEVFDK